MSKIRIRFTVTSGNLEDANSFDCYKWIRHLATNKVKTDDLFTLYSGRFPASKMFVLDMIEFLRKSDDLLDRFIVKRSGIKQDDLLSIENDAVRQLLNRDFPELVEEFANSEAVKKVIKRRPGQVDLSPLVKAGGKG